MPSKTDFNVSPYYDDFSEDKKFHRVMYRPAYAVQARELTTQQTILQNQIEKMSDSMFKHGAMVVAGEANYDLNYYAVKLTTFNGTLSLYNGNTLTGGTSGLVADVIGVVATDGTDPDTLFVKYRNSGTDNVTIKFTDGETVTSGQSAGSTAVVSTCATGSRATIDAGTYYINGFFVNVDSQILTLDKYTNTPSYRVGLTIVENFVTSTDDTTLLDNAQGSSNANATGAHRFKIDLTLTKLALDSTADASFVELFRLSGGFLQDRPISDVKTSFEDTLARRTFDESGDYAVRNFELDVREHLISGTNRGVYASGATSAAGNDAIESKLAFGLSQGKAYVKGYEIGKIGTTYIDVDKARDFDTASGITTRFNVGSFVNVENVFGSPDISFVSDEIENYKTLRLVDEPHTTRGTVFGTALAYVFDIGRAKTRAFEHHSGSATAVASLGNANSDATATLSNSGTTDTVFKHFLFDVEMFAHLNVNGKMSGALTTGDTLTGGTSGASGTVESITTAKSPNITAVTQTQPPVVTTDGAHSYTEGQQVFIQDVAGMTQLNDELFTVKNPTSTTLELFSAQSAATVTPTAVDASAYSTHTGSAGSIRHTVIILNNVKGEFVGGETITAPTNSRTGTVQFDSLGCKGFEQKQFNQTKGVSMAGSPTYTANASLDSTFGENVRLTGTVSTNDTGSSSGKVLLNATDGSATDAGDDILIEDGTFNEAGLLLGLEAELGDVIFGSGTRFLTELKIGDQITFTDDVNQTVTRVLESIASNTEAVLTSGLGNTSASSALITRQRTKLQDADKNIAISKMPYEVVKTLLTTDNDGVSDTSFKVRRQFVTTLSSVGTATITAGTNEIFSSFTENDVTVSIMSTGSGGTGAVGDIISPSTGEDYTLGGSPTGKTLSFNFGADYNGHKIKILATISASVVGAKTKTDTKQTNTETSEVDCTKERIGLNRADVHTLNAVYMSANFSTTATTSDTDITDRFKLDTGQRDNFYDVSRLERIPGKAEPSGQLLIDFNYFEHGAGNFFSVDSYSGFDYTNIPAYTSDITGESFALRDCLDFRPKVDDASTLDSGNVDRSFDGDGASALNTVKINTDITTDLEFYLAKKGRVYITSTGKFKVVEGASAIEPSFGDHLDDAMHLYDVDIPAYTFTTSSIRVNAIDNRRYTMRDIGNLHKRIETVEYYTQLSLLESNAQNMQIQDADGFDRFKNGIIVDNFTGHGTGDTSNDNYSVSMDMAAGELRPAHHMDNVNLIESNSALGDSTAMNDEIRTTNGYQKTGDLITLPYTEEAYITQSFASTTVNLNPYDVISYVGNVTINPDMDEWMETEVLPEMTINLPGPFDTLLGGGENGAVQELNMGTVWNTWNNNWSSVDVPGTEVRTTERQRRPNHPLIRDVDTTTINTVTVNNRTRQGVRTSLVPGGLQTQSLGNRVVQVAFATFMRTKDISFSANGLKPTTRMFPFFDGIDISAYVTPTGSSAGAALTTDAQGTATGVFTIPDPKVTTNPKWRVGKRAFRLTTSSTNVLVDGLVYSSAEADYTAKGMIETVQGSIISTREAVIKRTTATDTSVIVGATGTRIVRDDTGPWFDPICQSFMVDQKDGIFVTSVDLFFRTKSSTMPVNVQIRTMVNGYPTSEIVPFAEVSVPAANVTTSDDALSATTFTFPSPVFLSNNTEYSICAIANTDAYNLYTAKMGQTTLDGARLISQQPYLGKMFKSQNSTTWTAEQNEDVKFTINRAKFTTNTTGTVTLVNDITPAITLRKNPITTTNGSAVITIHHRNHGMHSTANNVTIAGVPSGTYNGIASANINGTYTTIDNIKLDSYTIIAQNNDTASATGDIGGTVVTATRNIMFDVIKPIASTIVPPGTTITSSIRTTTGRTLEQTETEFTLATSAKKKAVDLNTDYYLTAPQIVASAINETNEMSGSKSLSVSISMLSPTDDNISPVIDTARLSAYLIRNRIYSPVSGTTPDFIADTANTGGSGPAQYITKPVLLENEGTSLDVRLSAHVPSTSEVEMFFRLSNADDARSMNLIDWVPFNSDGSPDKAVPPSDDDFTFREHQYSSEGLTPFTAFQLKIILKGTSSSYPPRVKDMRGIALAV